MNSPVVSEQDDGQERRAAQFPREVYLMMRTDKRPGEAAKALAPSGSKAEKIVNMIVAVNCLIRAFKSELDLPFDPKKVRVWFGKEDQVKPMQVTARWETDGQPIIVECRGPGELETVLGGWKPQHQGAIADEPQIGVLFKPGDEELYSFASITGSDSGAVLKGTLRNLAAFSRLPGDIVEMKLRQINIHWGAPLKK